MTPILKVRLLGDFSISLPNQTTVETISPRLQSLIAYLLLHRHALQSRQHIAFLFWPDSDEAQARTNLRQLLYHLRQNLPLIEQLIEIDAMSLFWRDVKAVNCDVIDFEDALAVATEAQSQGRTADQHAALERAVSLYRGDLLRGKYDEWILEARAHLRQQYQAALVGLTHLLEIERAYQKAIAYTDKLRQHDPLREETYRLLMRLHALNNDLGSALKTYHECRDVLKNELGIEPTAETQKQYEQLRSAPAILKPREMRHVESYGERHLVGRQGEWESLLRIWKRTVEGHATLVNIVGEAGIGKTQLSTAFLTWAEHQGILTATARAYSAEGRVAYSAIIDWLRSESLHETLSHLDAVWRTEIGRLLPELQIDRQSDHITAVIDGGWQKRRLFESIAQVIFALKRPLLLLLDDLHWCDEESLDWIQYMLRNAASTPLLIVTTTRVEELTPDHTVLALTRSLHRTDQFAEIALQPLNSEETAALAQQVAGKTLNANEINALHADTEGNPLFIVEKIRAGSGGIMGAVKSGADTQMLSPKVQAIIEQRLAQLSPVARDLATFAAMLGRGFSIAELTAATSYDPETMITGIDELWQRRIIRERDGEWYDFSHDKLREVTLLRVSSARSRLYHLKVAQALEQTYFADTTAVSGRLAAHYEAAGQPEQAILFYEQAAEGARLVFASGKAIQLLRKALDILGTLPENTERDQRELAILTALGSYLVISEGYGSPEVWRSYERAYALCEKLGQPIAPPILRALALAYVLRGDFARTYSLGEQLVRVAEQHDDKVLVVEGYYVLGVTNFWMGRLDNARESLEWAIAHYDQQQHETHITLYAQDPKVICMCRLARTLWYLGNADQALEQMKDSLTLARILDHPYSHSYALAHAGFFFIDMRDWIASEDVISALRDLTTKHEFSLFNCLGKVLNDILRAQVDRDKANLDQIREGLERVQELEARLFLPQLLGYAANAYLKAGSVNEGLEYLSQAFNQLKHTDEHYFEAELYRLRGELELARGADTEFVTQQFTRALAVAQTQKAKSLELRTAISLCRFQISLGNPGKGISTLQSVYDTCSEGFRTPDLRDASTLLSNFPQSMR